MGLFLEKGERGLLVGQTGSGKTQNAIYQLRNAPVFPVILFDTKIEDAFFGLPEDDDSIELIGSLADFEKYAKLPKAKMADYILVRPGIHELQDYDILDQYCACAYERFGACTVYFDELYNWHNRGIPVNHFVGLLTRGRSRGKSVLQSTQRPGWISRFCFTESQKFYIHKLIDSRDKKTLDSMIPDFSSLPNPGKYGFYFYDVGHMDTPAEYGPVPYQELDKGKIFKRKWI